LLKTSRKAKAPLIARKERFFTGVHMGWAKLLKRVFNLDLEHCPNCGGELKIIAAILELSPDTKGPEDRLCLAHAKASVPWQSVD
jgi:hypothetical protein